MNSKYSEITHRVSRALTGFDRTQIEALTNLILALKSQDLSLDDFLSYNDEIRTLGDITIEHAHQARWKQLNVLCLECGYLLEFIPITLAQGKANVRGWKGVWSCSKCGFEAFTTNTLIEELHRLGVDPKTFR